MAVAASTGEMVGRTAERSVLDRLVVGVAGGAGAAVLVEGEAGIGKTRLVQSVIEAARGRGVHTMVGAARPFEATRPFGAVADALQLRRGSSDARRAAIGRLLGGEGYSRAASLGPDMRYRVVEEVIDLVEVQTRDAPLVIALEDLHWADDSTILVVRSMLDRITYLPVLLVGTMRPEPRSADLDLLLAEAAAAAGASLLRLAPLSPDDVDELVRAEVGRPPGPGLGEVVGRAAGNPLWVVEILRSLSAEGLLHVTSGRAGVTTATLPDSFRQLVLRRLRYLPDATLRTLRVAAVLGDTFSLVDLSTVSGRRALDLLEDLAPAVQAKLLGEDDNSLTFRHQLVHDAIYEDIPRSGRIAMHRDAARVLADAGAPIAQVAAHVLRGAVPGAALAVGWRRAAAREALPRAPDVAVEILNRVEELLVGHADRDLVTAELVEALLRAGEVAECAARAEGVLSRPHVADADAPLRLSLVSALSLQNRAPELIGQTQAALTAAPALSDADRALILAQASYGRTFSGDLTGGEEAARAALELARRCGDTGMTVWSLTTLSFAVKTQGRYAEAVDLTEQAVRLAFEGPDEQGRLRHPHFFLGMAMCDADRMPEAREAYREAVRECADLGSSWILPDIQQLSGELHFELGEWDDALAEIEAGVSAATERGNQVAIAQSLGYRAVIHAAQGDRRAAATALTALQAEVDGGAPKYGTEMVAYALAMLAEAEGRPVRAYETLLWFWQLDVDRRIRRFHRRLAPPLVRLALTLDHREVAADVAHGAEEAAALATDVPSMRAVARRCRGLVSGEPEMMLEAVELVRSGPRILDQAATLEDAAHVLASAGRTAEAQSLLLEALGQYDQLAAPAWAARVWAMLRDLGLRRGVRGARRRPATGWASLTDTERAVARLVAEGFTNREVGTRLFISPNTVNTHLRHVFQKLGVSSRSALTAATLRWDHAFE